MSDRIEEPPVEIELEEARIKVKASGILRLLDARERFQTRRRGKSDLPVFPTEPAA